MIKAAIVGLGRWGQILVNSVQDADGPKGEKIRFVRGVIARASASRSMRNPGACIGTRTAVAPAIATAAA